MDGQDQIKLAVKTGISLLGSDSNIAIPAKHIAGAHYLRQLLLKIADGQIALAPTMETLQEETEDG